MTSWMQYTSHRMLLKLDINAALLRHVGRRLQSMKTPGPEAMTPTVTGSNLMMRTDVLALCMPLNDRLCGASAITRRLFVDSGGRASNTSTTASRVSRVELHVSGEADELSEARGSGACGGASQSTRKRARVFDGLLFSCTRPEFTQPVTNSSCANPATRHMSDSIQDHGQTIDDGPSCQHATYKDSLARSGPDTCRPPLQRRHPTGPGKSPDVYPAHVATDLG